VTLQPAPGTVTNPHTPFVTGKDGRFDFTALDSGNYRLDFQGDGYVRQQYGQKIFGDSYSGSGAAVIAVGGGEAVKNIVMRLSPASILSGRVRDASGRPLVSVRVQLFRAEYDSNGEKGYQAIGSASTDDRGAYRIAGFNPGKYFLVAGGVPARSSNPNELPEITSFVFYPGVNDIAAASSITIAPGAELNGVDFTLKRETLHRIRGRVVDLDPSTPPDRTTVFYRSASLLRGSGESQGLFDPATRTVEIRDLAPGTYTIRVQTLAQTAGRGPRFTSHIAVSEITITDSDIDGVVWTTRPPSVLTGRITVEGPAPPTPIRGGFSLRPTFPEAAPAFQPPDASGAFQFMNVIPGEYRAVPAGLPTPYFVKSIRYGGVDILGRTIRIREGDTASFDVVIASVKFTQISGNVVDDRGQLAPSISVVLIPDQRDRADLYRVGRINGGPGHFTIPNLPPGNYKLFAWDAIAAYSYFDPDVMVKYEQRGKPLKIGDSATENVELKVIITDPVP
jgi:hypothetical protein